MSNSAPEDKGVTTPPTDSRSAESAFSGRPDLLAATFRAIDSARQERREAVHWIGDAPTSLHGNGAASFARTARKEAEVTCRLCLTLLAKGADDVE